MSLIYNKLCAAGRKELIGQLYKVSESQISPFMLYTDSIQIYASTEAYSGILAGGHHLAQRVDTIVLEGDLVRGHTEIDSRDSCWRAIARPI